MSKRIEKNGKFYRMRRGELVEIPEQWVGVTTSPQKIRNRPSKSIHKLRKKIKHYNNSSMDEKLEKIQAKDEQI